MVTLVTITNLVGVTLVNLRADTAHVRGRRDDQEEADEIDLDPDSDEADDFAECISPYE